MNRVVLATFLFVALPVSAQQISSELAAPQIVDRSTTAGLGPVDPLRVDQPPVTAVDRCGRPFAAGCEERESVLLDQNAPGSDTVEVREDGAYLKLEPVSDDTFDPEKIAERLESEETPSPGDWGVGGVVQQADDPVTETEVTAPVDLGVIIIDTGAAPTVE